MLGVNILLPVFAWCRTTDALRSRCLLTLSCCCHFSRLLSCGVAKCAPQRRMQMRGHVHVPRLQFACTPSRPSNCTLFLEQYTCCCARFNCCICVSGFVYLHNFCFRCCSIPESAPCALVAAMEMCVHSTCWLTRWLSVAIAAPALMYQRHPSPRPSAVHRICRLCILLLISRTSHDA